MKKNVVALHPAVLLPMRAPSGHVSAAHVYGMFGTACIVQSPVCCLAPAILWYPGATHCRNRRSRPVPVSARTAFLSDRAGRMIPRREHHGVSKLRVVALARRPLFVCTPPPPITHPYPPIYTATISSLHPRPIAIQTQPPQANKTPAHSKFFHCTAPNRLSVSSFPSPSFTPPDRITRGSTRRVRATSWWVATPAS